MASAGYVREYFDHHAREWLEQAYAEEHLPSVFPLGDERVRVALEGIAPAVQSGAHLADLGCGGGQLCGHAARLGLEVVGVDAAPGMIAAAEELCATLDQDAATRIRLVVAPFDSADLPAGDFHAVTAMGLLEYLPEDGPLLREAHRLLRPGGLFAVSCRNRLFSLASSNDYTASEIASGRARLLLAELRELVAGTRPDDLQGLARELAAAAEELQQAAATDETVPAPEMFHHPSSFSQDRRQHTPAELRRSAEAEGLEVRTVLPLHHHPLPPAVEGVAPRVYNRLALAWQHGLGSSPLGLAYASSFVAVLARP
jgi:SAM-dependent methyltransferase